MQIGVKTRTSIMCLQSQLAPITYTIIIVLITVTESDIINDIEIHCVVIVHGFSLSNQLPEVFE